MTVIYRLLFITVIALSFACNQAEIKTEGNTITKQKDNTKIHN